MRSFFFVIIFGFFSCFLFAGGNISMSDSESKSLGGCSISTSNIWSSLNNQAGLAKIKYISFGLAIENQYGLKELSNYAAVFALPLHRGVLSLNLNYNGFELYNNTKVGLGFGKQLSKTFALGIQLDYLGIYIAEKNITLSNYTFEIGVQKELNKKLLLGVHLINPTSVSINKNELIPTLFKIGLRHQTNSKVRLLGEYELESEQEEQLKFGIGYQLIKELELRIGINTKIASNSFGLGYNLNNININFSVTRHEVLGYSTQFSVSNHF